MSKTKQKTVFSPSHCKALSKAARKRWQDNPNADEAKAQLGAAVSASWTESRKKAHSKAMKKSWTPERKADHAIKIKKAWARKRRAAKTAK